jgi:CRP-like cAMP-binding protein
MFSSLRNYLEGFVPISDADWQMLEPDLRSIELDKKENFLQIGQVCRNISFVTEGAVRSFEISSEGKEICTFFGFAPVFVTDYWSLLTQSASQLTFQTLEPSVIIQLPIESVKRGYELSHRWERVGRLMAEQVFMQEIGRRNDLLHKSPAERYEYIENNHPDWILRIPQIYLSSYLGITPESLSRLRKRRIKD